MIVKDGKEYFPLGITQILTQNGYVYDIAKREKPYVYIEITNTESKGE